MERVEESVFRYWPFGRLEQTTIKISNKNFAIDLASRAQNKRKHIYTRALFALKQRYVNYHPIPGKARSQSSPHPAATARNARRSGFDNMENAGVSRGLSRAGDE